MTDKLTPDDLAKLKEAAEKYNAANAELAKSHLEGTHTPEKTKAMIAAFDAFHDACDSEVIAAIIAENERLRDENFALASWQCIHLDGKTGLTSDERGNQSCAKDAAIRALLAENAKLREALEWYGEQARLARLIHSEGDQGRHNLSGDGGKRARTALGGNNDV